MVHSAEEDDIERIEIHRVAYHARYRDVQRSGSDRGIGAAVPTGTGCAVSVGESALAGPRLEATGTRDLTSFR